MKKVIDYVYQKQENIRAHENAVWLQEQGVKVALGHAHFTGRNEIEVNGIKYQRKR
jgi:pyruvate/2-oxoglutarate dehydrogenase complex dihydrolipoamide dehydrogenase (E3) component